MTTSIDIARRIAEVHHPLSRESVHALAEIIVCRKNRKGEIVLQAGEVSKAMLFIEKG
ncbi:Crp/Fnr family transcriptional regulator, partial [Phocaeicola vulgatus]|nr:Crp/Fnr family transcriptional regulator [Phocaeicola vulgatus]